MLDCVIVGMQYSLDVMVSYSILGLSTYGDPCICKIKCPIQYAFALEVNGELLESCGEGVSILICVSVIFITGVWLMSCVLWRQK